MKYLKQLYVIVIFLLSVFFKMQAAIHYVDVNAIGINDGTSWINAFNSLQVAINESANVDTILVAEGQYYPSQTLFESSPSNPLNRWNTFYFENSTIKIFGGFEGNETTIEQRDWKNNKTILSGDIGILNDDTDNVYHIVYTKNVSDKFLIDGFTLQNGNANAPSDGYNWPNYIGGAWYNDGSNNGSSNPNIRNCTFIDNLASSGAAMYNFASNGLCSPYLINCWFINNRANFGGGAMYNNAGVAGICELKIENCIYLNNYAFNYGGAIYNISNPNGFCKPEIDNCTFIKNTANFGAALSNYALQSECKPVIRNCILWDNYSNNGKSLYNLGANISIINSLVEELDCAALNAGSSTSTVVCDDMIFAQDPLFVDASNNDFNLQMCSPAINSGLNNNLLEDLAGNPRIVNNVIDIGAFEFQSNMECDTLVNNNFENWSNEITINLSPNPTENVLNIKATNFNLENYKITNLLGKVIARNNFQPQIDVSELETGIYFISFNANNYTYRFVKK